MMIGGEGETLSFGACHSSRTFGSDIVFKTYEVFGRLCLSELHGPLGMVGT